MADLTETAVWRAGIHEIPTSEDVLGGTGAGINIVTGFLTDRTAYLKQELDALTAAFNSSLIEIPYTSLPYPTIDTSDNKIGATGSSVLGYGGTVTVPAGRFLSLAKTGTHGGNLRSFTTLEWTSANLDINSTYYLRCQVDGDDLVWYVQKGTDADTIPVSLLGTPNGSSGGGFDSTIADILAAKVVTGSAGSVPTVTNLANANRLTSTVTKAATSSPNTTVYTLNWGRAPSLIALQGMDPPGGSYDSDYEIRVSASSRYSVSIYAFCWHQPSSDYSPGYTYQIQAH